MGRMHLHKGAARTMTKARKNVICFVLPNDRGHLNYTIHIARALDERGYQIEYSAPAGASEYAPKFAKFTGLTEPSDDRFDRFTRLYCNLCSYGDTPEEGNAHLGENWETSLAKEFPVFAPGNAIPSDQQEAMASSGLLKWLNNDNDKKD